jgi:hypothetical protein
MVRVEKGSQSHRDEIERALRKIRYVKTALGCGAGAGSLSPPAVLYAGGSGGASSIAGDGPVNRR